MVSFEGLLIGIAQLGVAIAGFAGVVAAFRQEPLADLQSYRLHVLVRTSLGVTFMALLPSLFFAAFRDERQAIGSASGSSAVWMLLTVIALQRQLLRVGSFWSRQNLISLPFAIIATGLFAVNAVSLDAWWPFLGGLVLVLMTAALAFQRLIGVRKP